MMISASPVSICREAWIAASKLDPQSLLSVVPGTLTGKPDSNTDMRATLRFSSPAPLALPSSTSSIRSGGRFDIRLACSPTTSAARSSGRVLAREPPYFPNGVRTAS